MVRDNRTPEVIAYALGAVGCALGAAPPWLLPSAFVAPFAALLVAISGFLIGPVSRRTVWVGAGFAAFALLASVAWFTVGSPLWLPALQQQLPAGLSPSVSLATLAHDGLVTGANVAALAAICFFLGVGLRELLHGRLRVAV